MIRYSFVIPTYNNLNGLTHCLSALLKTYTPDDISYEILIVDDGSSDGTYEYVVSTYNPEIVKCLRLERDSKSSRSRARNFGVENSMGEIVNFIDSDILVSPQHIVQLESFFSKNSNILLVGNRNFSHTLSQDSEGAIHFSDFRYQIYVNQSFNANAINFPWAVCYSCNLSVSRKHLLEIGLFDENFVSWGLEDLELGYRFYRHGLRICFNSLLNVTHLGHDSRDELFEDGARLDGYKRNIAYFIKKHSLADIYPNEDLNSLLIDGVNLCADAISALSNNSIFSNKFADCSTVKTQVNNILHNGKTVVLLDYSATSMLEYWVNVHPLSHRIFYFPTTAMRQVDQDLLYRRLGLEAQ